MTEIFQERIGERYLWKIESRQRYFKKGLVRDTYGKLNHDKDLSRKDWWEIPMDKWLMADFYREETARIVEK